MLVPLIGALGVALAGVAWRLGAAGRAERAYAARRAPGVDGIVPGAEGFTLPGSNGRALLLLHGSGDTPQTLRFLAERLQGAGYTVRVPLLPGHGRGLRDFAAATAADYVRSVRGELNELGRQFDWIGLVGLSMGGALAARLAAKDLDVRVLVLLAPYLTPPATITMVGRMSRLWEVAAPYLSGRGDASVHDPNAREGSLSYGVFPPRAVAALVETAAAARHALPAITAPTLVVQSREDNRIPFSLAQHATATLRAPTERHWVAGCGHVITVDYCRNEVAALVLDFLARHAD